MSSGSNIDNFNKAVQDDSSLLKVSNLSDVADKQIAINTITDVDNATTGQVLTKDLNGNAVFLDATGGGGGGAGLTQEQYTKLENTFGINTGDETQATIKSKLQPATPTRDGYLTSTDYNTFNDKLNNFSVSSYPEKISLVDEDIFLIEDSTNSFYKKKVKASSLGFAGFLPNSIIPIVGEKRKNYVPFVDIKLSLDTYQTEIIETYDLLNDVNNVRLRFVLLDVNGIAINTNIYFWSGGSSTASNGGQAAEYGSSELSGSLSGIRLYNGSASEIVGNVNKIKIEIKKASNNNINVRTEFNYWDSSSYSLGGSIENLVKITANVSAIRIFASSGNIKGSFYRYALLKSDLLDLPNNVMLVQELQTTQSVQTTKTVQSLPQYY
jgi:hypothetical protein